MKTKILPLWAMLVMAITQHLHAQNTCGLYEVPLSQRIDQATLIVEAKVLSSESFQLNPDEIFTRHRLEVFKLFKGSLPSEIEVITYGGEVNGLRQTYTNLLTLHPGEQGVFFLIPSPLVSDAYQAYASSQGVVKYVSDDLGNMTGQEPFHHYHSVEQEVFQAIEGQTGQDRVSLATTDYERRLTDWLTRKGLNTNVRSDGPTLIYGFANPVLTGPASEFLDFEVYARTLWGSFEFGESAIYLDYNPQVFGSNVVANGKLSVSKGDLIISTSYTLTISDETASQVKIEIDAAPGSLEDIGMAADEVLNLSIEIGNAFQNPDVYFDEGIMQGNSSFYELVTQTFEPFSYVFAEDSIISQFGTSAVDILSFSPDTVAAGVGDTITIVGEDFGPQRDGFLSDGRVQFTRQYEGYSGGVTQIWYEPLDSDSSYLEWSDTLIRVVVPSITDNDSVRHTAATGDIRVWKRDNPFPNRSDDPLTVKYALKNVVVNDGGTDVGRPILFSDANGEGGVSIYYASSFRNLAIPFRAAFERALTKWRCNTGINFAIIDTLPAFNPNKPAPSIISSGQLAVGAMVIVKASTSTNSIECPDINGAIPSLHSFTGFSIIFDSTLNWYTGVDSSLLPANEYDFESTVLHELGHAHLFLHSNNPDDLMWFEGPAGVERRTITPNELEGGIYLVNESAAPHVAFYQCDMRTDTLAPMIPVTAADCDRLTSIFSELEPTVGFEAYPNPTTGPLTLRFNQAGNIMLRVIDIAGRTVQMLPPTRHSGEIYLELGAFPSGIYLLQVSSDDRIEYLKIVKQ